MAEEKRSKVNELKYNEIELNDEELEIGEEFDKTVLELQDGVALVMTV